MKSDLLLMYASIHVLAGGGGGPGAACSLPLLLALEDTVLSRIVSGCGWVMCATLGGE